MRAWVIVRVGVRDKFRERNRLRVRVRAWLIVRVGVRDKFRVRSRLRLRVRPPRSTNQGWKISSLKCGSAQGMTN